MPSTDKIFICGCWVLIDMYGLYVFFYEKFPGSVFCLWVGGRKIVCTIILTNIPCSALCIFLRIYAPYHLTPRLKKKVPSSLGLVEATVHTGGVCSHGGNYMYITLAEVV